MLVAAIFLDRVAQFDQLAPLPHDVVAQQFHATHQRAIIHGDLVQVLVSCYQLAKRPCGQERFCRIEGPALVDVRHPLLQRRASILQVALGHRYAIGRLRHVVGDCGELTIECLEHQFRGCALAIDVGDFLAQIVHVALQVCHTTLELRALPPDTIKLLALRTNASVRRLRAHAQRHDQDERQHEWK